MKLKTILNRLQPLKRFIYQETCMVLDRRGQWKVDISIRPHRQRAACCSRCGRPLATYDTLPERIWAFVPILNVPAFLHYSPRRVNCPEHGVVVEALPWSDGKRPYSKALMLFLGNWARRLSWKETALIFKVSWQAVYRSVEWMVEWGLAHRELANITAIGVDELHVGNGKKSKNYLTLIYQIDAQCRRLLWVGQTRRAAALRKGLQSLGKPVLAGIRHICSDMWRPYLKVIAASLSHGCHMIDRFHVVQTLNAAVDEVRRRDMAAMTARPAAKQKLKKMRWTLLRRKTRVRGKAREMLDRILGTRLQTGRAYLFKESFQHFWSYHSPTWARNYLQAWVKRACRSRIAPIIKAAKTIAKHEELLLNWIRARNEVFTGATEGLNNKARVVTKRSYGFRTFHGAEMALYHTLGQLPEPVITHKFW